MDENQARLGILALLALFAGAVLLITPILIWLGSVTP